MIYLLIYLIGTFITIWAFKKFNMLDPHNRDEDETFLFIAGTLFWPLAWMLLLVTESMMCLFKILVKIFVKIYDIL